MNKKAQIFVLEIIFEKIADAPVFTDGHLLMAEWIMDVTQQRGHLISLKNLIESKKQIVDASALLARLREATEILKGQIAGKNKKAKFN